MNKKKILVAGAALACAGALGVWLHTYVGDLQYLEQTDNAYVKADSILISPKISGYVARVEVEDNQAVRAGMPLLRIEAADYAARQEQLAAALRSQQAALATANVQQSLHHAQIAQAQATLRGAVVQQAKAVHDHARDAALLAKGFISEERSDSSRTQLDAAAAGLAHAQAQLDGARAQLAVLNASTLQSRADIEQSAAVLKAGQLDLANATLTAPRDGIIANKLVTVGQYVKAGTQLMTVVPVNQSYVVANFKETQIRRIQPGQTVKIRADADAALAIDGVVDSIAPATGSEFSLLPPENATGNFTKIVQRVPVKIALLNGAGAVNIVRPGMSVTVVVDTRKPAMQRAHVSGAAGARPY